MTATQPTATIIPFPRSNVVYGVFRHDGQHLGDWQTREQAEAFVYPRSGRRVEEIEKEQDHGA